MTALRQSLILCLLLMAAGAALAQVLEVGGGAGVNRISNGALGSDTSTPPNVGKVNNGWRMGFRMTINTHSHFGHEAGYNYVRTNLDYAGTTYGTATHQGFYDLLGYVTPDGSKVRPFVAGGAQFSNFIPPGGSVSQGSGSMKFGLNYGGGVKVRVTDKWLMRLDYRKYVSPKPDWFENAPSGWIRMNEVSMGVAYCL